jgi:hypothetical protein
MQLGPDHRLANASRDRRPRYRRPGHRAVLLAVGCLATWLLGCSETVTPIRYAAPSNAVVFPARPEPIVRPEMPPPPVKPRWQDCQAGDQAWVRRALLGIAGRRAHSTAEVQVWSDLVAALRHQQTGGAVSGTVPGKPTRWDATLTEPRRAVALLMGLDEGYGPRWRDFVLDALRVNRVEVKSMADCYALPASQAVDTGLAVWVRDHSPREPFSAPFTMGEVVASALALDDLSPIWRGHLLAMLGKPMTAANVGPAEMERARRQDFGRLFDAAYLHRDRACMGCHNSEFSVTYNADAALNRHWPVAGKFERALFGSATGKPPDADAADKGPADLRAHAVFRHWGVADGDNRSAPWGWAEACGLLKRPTDDDPLGHDAWFGSLRGRRVSVWDVQAALARGFERIAKRGLQLQTNAAHAGEPDPDDALAWLVAQSIVEHVWQELMGAPLTVANWFPRTEDQRDTLEQLTRRFVASSYSLRRLLADIAVHPAFALAAPEVGCGDEAHGLPRLLDPWSNHAADASRRGNSPGDVVHGLSPRLLLRSLHAALGWPAPAEFPSGPEQALQTAAGVFLKDGEPGARGLDFQSRLAWEASYGACVRQGAHDHIDALVERIAAVPASTWEDAIATLKDQLIGEPWVATSERPLVEALLGISLTDPPGADAGDKLRRLCGVLVATPQFLLGGLAPAEAFDVPVLTAPAMAYGGRCAAVAELVNAQSLPWRMACDNTGLKLQPRSAPREESGKPRP